MNLKTFLVDFVTVFAVTLIVSAFVTSLSNLIVHGESTVNWEASFRYAALFSIVLSSIATRRRKCDNDGRALLPERCAGGQGPVG
jgi:hypothetical protein